MTPEERAAHSNRMRMVSEDCVTDSTRRDGEPFTGNNVGAALGEIAAQIKAIADTVKAMLDGVE